MGYTTLINHIVETAWKRSEKTPFLKELQKNRAERAKARRQVAKSIQSLETVEKEKERAEAAVVAKQRYRKLAHALACLAR